MKTMAAMIVAGAAVVLGALPGCSAMTMHPRIVYDLNLSAADQVHVYEAMTGWGDVVPAVRAESFTGMTHDRLEAFARQAHETDNTIMILALSDSTQDCPGYGPLTSAHMGLRHVTGPNRSAVICVDMGTIQHEVDVADWGKDALRGVLSHELGHAMGLPDAQDGDGNRVMALTQHPWDAPTATCQDARDLAGLWGVGVAEQCR